MKGHRVDITPIGVARSPYKTPGAPPFQSAFTKAEGTIEVYEEYRDGLLSIDGFSHLIILSYFDRADQRSLSEKPLSDGDVSHGIFATRHFNRPNPIGISYVGLDRVSGSTLHVRGIDLLDGTPVLDIKPYVPAFDSIPVAVTGWVTARHIENIRTTALNARGDVQGGMPRKERQG
jgi:tRNA-Thr(GGU) m(6)t(6)A37 methyltransferase TsaA